MDESGVIKRFRYFAVGLSLGATVVSVSVSFLLGLRIIGMGLLYGGLAGTVTFWILAYRVQKFAEQDPHAIQSEVYRWTFVRLVIYGVALYRAYTLDTITYHGLFAALAGLFIIRLVLTVLAVTGWDKKRGDS